MLTEAAIQAAVTRVKKGRKATETLTDPAPRGAGRLTLVVKSGRAEWYAQRWSDGRRKMQKLGAYPAMSLAEARERHAGHKPADGRESIGALLDAYLTTLEGRTSHKQASSVLGRAGEALGRGRLARDITPTDIVAVIRPIHRAGHAPMAEKFRMFLSAAFQWAIESTHDYRTDAARDWGLSSNPVGALPVDRDAYRAGERWLDAGEFVQLLRWATAGRPKGGRAAVALSLLTGQRVTEILRITTDTWSAQHRTLHWPVTKNGRPHTIPVCTIAAGLLDSMRPNDAGVYFPGSNGAQFMTYDALRAVVRRAGHEGFAVRDLRRTWKTLAGEAGLTKAERDMLQNHGQTGVSSKHYDRWQGMPEKLAAIGKWEAWLQQQLGDQHADHQAQDVVHAQQ